MSKQKERRWIYHLISAAILALSLVYLAFPGWNVTLRTWQAIKDLGNSCVFYASKMTELFTGEGLGAEGTVQYIPEMWGALGEF